MKYPIDGLVAFVQIAELGSFIKASEKLCLTQTALTRRIQRLESCLGLKLLDRTTRVVSLSAVGRSFLPEAKRLLDEFDRSFERLRRQSKDSVGDVTMTSPPSLMFGRLPKILAEYSALFPSNRVQILDRNSTQAVDAVLKRHADFGLHVRPAGHPDLDTELLQRDPFVAYCRSDSPLAGCSSVRWRDLASFDLITLGGDSGNRTLMEAQLQEAGIDIHTRFVVEYFSSAYYLAHSGLGIAVLVAKEGGPSVSDLVQVPIVEPVIDRPLFLVRRKGETLTPAAQRLFEMIRQSFFRKEPTTPAESGGAY